jgi:RNA polymerase sigma-70 factor, ECF subfamily
MEASPNRPGSAAAWDWSQARRTCLKEAQRLLGACELAEDAAQNAVLRAWSHQAACRSPDPGPWLRRIAHNEAVRALSGPAPLRLEEERSEPAGDMADWPSDAGRVRELVCRLSPADRRLLFLQHWADMPIQEIAERLCMPEGTVKIRLHRARAALRQMIEDEP